MVKKKYYNVDVMERIKQLDSLIDEAREIMKLDLMHIEMKDYDFTKKIANMKKSGEWMKYHKHIWILSRECSICKKKEKFNEETEEFEKVKWMKKKSEDENELMKKFRDQSYPESEDEWEENKK